MGGGAAIRSAAKFAGEFKVAEHSLRNAAPHVPEALSSPPPLRAMAGDVAPVYTSAPWDLDDWVVANIDGTEPNTERVVFGVVPSFEEAKAATSQLKSAVEKIYLSASCSKSECSSPHSGSQASWASPQINNNHSHIIDDTIISFPPVPINAFHQPFHLLSSNPEAHNVVASIASDSNVWNAVMQNSTLKDFFRSHYAAGVEEGLTVNEEIKKLPDSDLGSDLVDYMSTTLNKASITVAEIVTSMSSYVKNIFGPISTEKSFGAAFGITTTTTTKENNFMNPTVAMGGTFMGLAMLVMILVILKRA